MIMVSNRKQPKLKKIVFERFLRSQREEWQAKKKEVEEKFLELSSLSDELAAAPSVAKKRKRERNSNSCPQVQQDPFAAYTAELQISFFKKVCSDWRDIALTIHDKVFADDEEQLIDIHDVKWIEFLPIGFQPCCCHYDTRFMQPRTALCLGLSSCRGGGACQCLNEP